MPMFGSAELTLGLNSSRSSADTIRFKLSQTTSEVDLSTQGHLCEPRSPLNQQFCFKQQNKR